MEKIIIVTCVELLQFLFMNYKKISATQLKTYYTMHYLQLHPSKTDLWTAYLKQSIS